MPIEGLLLDAGPLIAYLVPDEKQHPWACREMDKCQGKLVTCEPVLTEAFFLLRALPAQVSALERILCDDIFDLSFALAKEAAPVVALKRAYRDRPMSLADACLVRLSELHPRLPVLTLDSDFAVYRRNKRDFIPVIAPPRD